MTIFIPCIPPKSTAQSKRVNHKTGHFFKSKAHEAAINSLTALLIPHAPSEPVAGPVTVAVTFCWPYRTTDKKAAKAGFPIVHTSKPDLDNLAKGFCDVLVQLRFIEDDAKIGRLILEKCWGPIPGIDLTVEPL